MRWSFWGSRIRLGHATLYTWRSVGGRCALIAPIFVSLSTPAFWAIEPCRKLGLRRVEYRGKLLQTTGPERTLIEGFRRLTEVGGLQELVNSASGFAVLDLELLQEILLCYDIANLWAAVGWFLECFRQTFLVTEDILNQMV